MGCQNSNLIFLGLGKKILFIILYISNIFLILNIEDQTTYFLVNLNHLNLNKIYFLWLIFQYLVRLLFLYRFISRVIPNLCQSGLVILSA